MKGGAPSSATPASTLGLVALVMKGHPEIKKVRIEVYAEGISKDEMKRAPSS